MEIKLWRAVVQYFAPIFPADESGEEGESYEEEWCGRGEAGGSGEPRRKRGKKAALLRNVKKQLLSRH